MDQKTGSHRRRAAFLTLAILLLAGAGLAGALLLPRQAPQPTPVASASPPAPSLVPTFTPTARPAPSDSPVPAVLHPTLTGVSAQPDDAAGTILFRAEGQIAPDRQVAEVLLWYDTEVGRSVQRLEAPRSPAFSVIYRLDAAEEGLTRTLTTTSELDYWWQVRDSAGEAARAGGTASLGRRLQALVTVATPKVAVDFSWAVSETRHYEFYCAPGTAAERDRFLVGALAERALRRVQEVLEAESDDRMRIYLVPRVFWQGGATYGDKVQLISYLDRNYTGIDTWSYFAHEGTHALAQDLLQPKEEGGPDGVLVEGLAVWTSGGHYGLEPVDEWASVVAGSDEYLPLPALRAGPFYDFQHEISYLEAGSFVGFLVEQYGLDRLKALYGQATGKAEQDEALARQVFGKGYGELEADWLNALEALSPTAAEAEAWWLQVRSFDLMRRYETEMDPSARILPDTAPPEWTSETLRIFLHPVDGRLNLVLETALIEVQEQIREGELEGATKLLGDIEAALDDPGAALPPSLEVRRAILEVLDEQDRAILRADAGAYLETLDPAYAQPPDWREWLQTPFTLYRQELVRLALGDDGVSAGGVIRLHAGVADAGWGEHGMLFAVTFRAGDGRWRLASREPAGPLLAPLP